MAAADDELSLVFQALAGVGFSVVGAVMRMERSGRMPRAPRASRLRPRHSASGRSW